MINAGDIVTCQVTSQTTFSQNASDVIQAASSILASEGYGVLNSQEQDAGILDTILSAGYIAFQVTMQVQVPTAFAQPTDVLSIVENAFYQVTGAYPTAGSVPSVQTPGSGIQSTGLPGLSSTGIGGSSSGVTSQAVSGLSSLGSTLGSIGTYGVVGIVAIVLILLLLVGFAPNTRDIARAVR
jgi:hypothetical protein